MKRTPNLMVNIRTYQHVQDLPFDGKAGATPCSQVPTPTLEPSRRPQPPLKVAPQLADKVQPNLLPPPVPPEAHKPVGAPAPPPYTDADAEASAALAQGAKPAPQAPQDAGKEKGPQAQ